MSLFGLFSKKEKESPDSTLDLPPIQPVQQKEDISNVAPQEPDDNPFAQDFSQNKPVQETFSEQQPEEEISQNKPVEEIPEPEEKPMEETFQEQATNEIKNQNIQDSQETPEQQPEEEKLISYDEHQTQESTPEESSEDDLDKLFENLPKFEEPLTEIEKPASYKAHSQVNNKKLYVNKENYISALENVEEAKNVIQNQSRKQSKLALINDKMSKTYTKNISAMELLHKNMMKIEEKLTR